MRPERAEVISVTPCCELSIDVWQLSLSVYDAPSLLASFELLFLSQSFHVNVSEVYE